MDAGLRAPEGPGQRFEPGCGACLVQAVCLAQAKARARLVHAGGASTDWCRTVVGLVQAGADGWRLVQGLYKVSVELHGAVLILDYFR